MFHGIRKRAKCDRIHFSLRFLFCRSVRQYTRKFRNIGDPAAVFFSVEQNNERRTHFVIGFSYHERSILHRVFERAADFLRRFLHFSFWAGRTGPNCQFVCPN